MKSDIPTANVQASSVRYQVVFVNNSLNTGSACLYQLYRQDPDFDSPGVMSLAWFAKEVSPATRAVFEWTLDYCFVWARLGRLKPGNLFKTAQVVPADPTSTNDITFGKQQGGDFSLQGLTERRPQGRLYVRGDGTFFPNQAAVGIGMSGQGTFVAPAQPQWIYVFTPLGPYRIAFGDYKQGQVLDVAQVGNPAEIEFPPGIYSMTATLNRDNSWSVEPIFDGED